MNILLSFLRIYFLVYRFLSYIDICSEFGLRMDSAFCCSVSEALACRLVCSVCAPCHGQLNTIRMNIQLSVNGCSGWVGCSVIYCVCNVGTANVSTSIESVNFFTLRDIWSN